MKETFTDSREQSEMEAAFGKTQDPIAESPADGKSVAGIINRFVDDLFGTSGKETEQGVLARLRKNQVASEDLHDKEFVGHKITKNGQ